jgi:hypothetical protein
MIVCGEETLLSCILSCADWARACHTLALNRELVCASWAWTPVIDGLAHSGTAPACPSYWRHALATTLAPSGTRAVRRALMAALVACHSLEAAPCNCSRPRARRQRGSDQQVPGCSARVRET